MKMTMTRKGFLGAVTGGTVLLLLQACGGGDDDSSTPSSPAAPAPAPAPPAAGSECGSSGAAVSGNHGHALEIPEADLDSTVNMTYSIQGTSGHDHTVTFTPAQLQLLKAGQAVTVTSSATFQHEHNVTVTCA
jgi:hypothetical protein